MQIQSPVTPIDTVKCFAHIWLILSNHADKFVPEYFDKDTEWSWEINVINDPTNSGPDDIEVLGLVFTDLKGINVDDILFSWDEVAEKVSGLFPEEFTNKQS